MRMLLPGKRVGPRAALPRCAENRLGRAGDHGRSELTSAAGPVADPPRAQPTRAATVAAARCRSPGSWSTSRCRTSTGPSTTWYRPTWTSVVPAGSRVRVRFAGRLVDAYVLERRAAATTTARLAFVERAVGDEPVLTAETTALFRAVADRWAGNFVDVVRLGVPSRHAARRGRAQLRLGRSAALPPRHGPGGLGAGTARAGGAFSPRSRPAARHARCGRRCPGEPWPRPARRGAGGRAGRGARRDRGGARRPRPRASRRRADVELLGAGHHVALSADLGPAERYRRWLAVRRGHVRAVIGTRAAGYAPVGDLGLLAIWDDGDDLHAEPRAPYAARPRRGRAAVRADRRGVADRRLRPDRRGARSSSSPAGRTRSPPTGPASARHAPRVVAVGDDVEQARDPAAAAARLPSLAWRDCPRGAGRRPAGAGPGAAPRLRPGAGLRAGPHPGALPACSGPAGRGGPEGGGGLPVVRAPGWPTGAARCAAAGALRAVSSGSARTAEELGRAFPGVPVRTVRWRPGAG